MEVVGCFGTWRNGRLAVQKTGKIHAEDTVYWLFGICWIVSESEIFSIASTRLLQAEIYYHSYIQPQDDDLIYLDAL